MKRIIIGDIHGCFDELMQLLVQAGINEQDQIISVGDIVDRGPRSFEVYQYLKTRPNTVVLMGNHERKHVRGVLSYSQEIVKLQCGDGYNEMLEWFKTLPYYYEFDAAVVVHAGVEHDVMLAKQRQDVLSGTTSGEKYLQKKYAEKHWSDFYDWGKPIVYGHHIVGDKAENINNKIYGLDTGCCHGKSLSGLVLPEFSFVSVKSKLNYWKKEISKWQFPVLKVRPWMGYKLSKIRRVIEDYGRKDDINIQQYIQSIQTWIDELPGIMSKIVCVIDKHVAAELLSLDEQVVNHRLMNNPYKHLVYKSLKQKLNVETLISTFNTPKQIFALSRYYKVECANPFE